jgi:hypothetical protein
MSVGIGAKELCHAIWCILAISIHYDDSVAASCLLNVYQPNGDSPLVAKITAQSQPAYDSHRREATLKLIMVVPFHRSVIDQEYLHGAGIARNGTVQPPDQLRGRGPVVPEGHDHCEVQRWMMEGVDFTPVQLPRQPLIGG